MSTSPWPTSPWIRSARWDSFWILSGFWLPLLFVLLPLSQAKPVVLALTLGLWIAHRLSSVYLALCVREYRSVLAAKKGYFAGWPLAIFVLLMGYLFCPNSLLPLSQIERFLLLAFADYFFSLYHFAVQHYGVLSVYRSRLPHGQRDAALLKWDFWACLMVSGAFSLVLDFLYGDFNFFGLLQPPVLLTDPGLLAAIKAVLSLGVLLFWGLTLRIYLRKNQGRGRILYFSSLCAMSLVSFQIDPFLYFSLVQLQHWGVSLGLTSMMAGNSQSQTADAPRPNLWYAFWGWVNRRAWGPLLVLVTLSLLLTPILEADYFIVHGLNPEALVVQGFLPQFRDSLWLTLFGALAFFSSFLHYLYDRGVFRFSDSITRKAALGLLQPREKGLKTPINMV